MDDIRTQINNDIVIKPYSSRYKVYIVDEAEKMNQQAQNALLKTIEEPPAYAVILLLTTNADSFLPTISRQLHASTQAATRTPEQALFLERCGFARVILERALSLDEIRAIRAACGVDLECFVHGAICVGYSGRCFLSRSMSERSGNRGACSQPCRLTYDLVDESGRTVVKGRHLLSVRDLNLSDRIGELIDAGITSFKIEGRLNMGCI